MDLARTTEKPPSLELASAETFGWLTPSFAAAAAWASRRRAITIPRPLDDPKNPPTISPPPP